MTGNSNQNQSVIGRETIVDLASIKLSPEFSYKSTNDADAALSEDSIESAPLAFCQTKGQKLVFRAQNHQTVFNQPLCKAAEISQKICFWLKKNHKAHSYILCPQNSSRKEKHENSIRTKY
jgi:hypothetical protein